MPDLHFPLYPYDRDPLGIMKGRPKPIILKRRPDGTLEDPPAPPENPLPPGEGDHPKDGGGARAAHANGEVANQPEEDAPRHAPEQPDDARSPPNESRAGTAKPPFTPEQSERNRIMSAWLDEHWDTVEAMARAGEAPERPLPPPSGEGHGARRGGGGSPHQPAPARPERVERPPVHVARGDRWNKWKMAEFLRRLAATHSVTAAARAVGMSRASAYKLRSRLKGQPFDIAWEAAFRHGYDNLAHTALELAVEGAEVPHYYRGELVGTHRKHNEQLIVQLLKMRNRAGAPMLGRYGAAAEFWSENWEAMTHRVETGPVTWDEERRALGEAGRAKLALPDAEQEVDRIVRRNLPDEPSRGRGPS